MTRTALITFYYGSEPGKLYLVLCLNHAAKFEALFSKTTYNIKFLVPWKGTPFLKDLLKANWSWIRQPLLWTKLTIIECLLLRPIHHEVKCKRKGLGNIFIGKLLNKIKFKQRSFENFTGIFFQLFDADFLLIWPWIFRFVSASITHLAHHTNNFPGECRYCKFFFLVTCTNQQINELNWVTISPNEKISLLKEIQIKFINISPSDAIIHSCWKGEHILIDTGVISNLKS